VLELKDLELVEHTLEGIHAVEANAGFSVS